MMITSAICWGSWANTFKGVKNYRFELFYWDYALGIFLISLILALTMGSTSPSDADSLSEQRSFGRWLEHCLYADCRRHLQSGEPAAGCRESTWLDWPSLSRFRLGSLSWSELC